MIEFPPFFFSPVFILIVILGYILKGFALWHSAQKGQKVWFIAFMILHTFGILEIIYLFIVRKSKNQEAI